MQSNLKVRRHDPQFRITFPHFYCDILDKQITKFFSSLRRAQKGLIARIIFIGTLNYEEIQKW